MAWPVTAEARVQSLVSACGICGGESGTGTDFRPSTLVLFCHYLSTASPCSFILLSSTQYNLSN